MQIELLTESAAPSGKHIDVSDAAFDRDYSEALVHQVVTAYLAGARQGTVQQKNRSAVRGGGAKPWRQKGTGRARAGTIRSPLWRSGGVTFAAKPRDYTQKVNKKMYKAAMQSIFSELLRAERLQVVESFNLDAPKTKELKAKLDAFGSDKLLLLTAEVDTSLYLASRNLINVAVLDVNSIDPASLLKHDKVIATSDAIKALEERLG